MRAFKRHVNGFALDGRHWLMHETSSQRHVRIFCTSVTFVKISFSSSSYYYYLEQQVYVAGNLQIMAVFLSLSHLSLFLIYRRLVLY